MLRTDGVVPGGVGMTAAAGLGRGERAPDMVLASRDGTPTRYYAHAGGRPALLAFADQGCVARLDALAEGLTAIGDAALTRRVVGPAGGARGGAHGHRRGAAARRFRRPARVGRPRPAVPVAPGLRRWCGGRLPHP